MPHANRNGADTKFRAFSDQTRLRILHLLKSGELCVNGKHFNHARRWRTRRGPTLCPLPLRGWLLSAFCRPKSQSSHCQRSIIRFTAFGKSYFASASFAPTQFNKPGVSSGSTSASHFASTARAMMRSSSLRFFSTAVSASSGLRRKSTTRRTAWAAAMRTLFVEGAAASAEATTAQETNKRILNQPGRVLVFLTCTMPKSFCDGNAASSNGRWTSERAHLSV